MFGWQNQADLLNDVVDCSSFVSNPKEAKKYNYISHKKKTNTNNGLWYESDEEVDIGRGRGRLQNYSNNVGGTHLDVMQDIQMQVRNTVGNRYHNDAIESYLRVSQNAEEEQVQQPSCSETQRVISPCSFSKESSSLIKGRGRTSPIRTRGMRERNIARIVENSVAKEGLNINDKREFPAL